MLRNRSRPSALNGYFLSLDRVVHSSDFAIVSVDQTGGGFSA